MPRLRQCPICLLESETFECVGCVEDRTLPEQQSLIRLAEAAKSSACRIESVLEGSPEPVQHPDRMASLIDCLVESGESGISARRLRQQRAEVAFLKTHIAEQKKRLDQGANDIRTRVDALEAAQEQLRAGQAATSVEMLPVLINSIKSAKEAQTKQLQIARRQLMSDVLRLFPIHPSINVGSCTVACIDVPNSGDLSGLSEVEIGCLMGILVHVIKLVSKYMGAHLPHRMIFGSSWSTVIGEDGRQYRLSPTSKDFAQAVRLLNNNAVHLLSHCTRIKPMPRHQTSAAACLVDIFRSRDYSVGERVRPASWKSQKFRPERDAPDEWTLVDK